MDEAEVRPDARRRRVLVPVLSWLWCVAVALLTVPLAIACMAVVLVALVVLASPLLPGGRDDPREHQLHDTLQVTTEGTFEGAILPRFSTTLPCDVSGLRYYDDEDLTGPYGQLYLRFETSQRCLDQFLHEYSFHPPTRMSGDDPLFPLDVQQGRFGWRFDATRRYDVYWLEVTMTIHGTAVVERTDDGSPVVHTVIHR